ERGLVDGVPVRHQVQRLLGAGGGHRGGQVLGDQHGPSRRLADGERRRLRGALGHLDLVVDGRIALAVVGGDVLEQGREAAQRGEAPLLDIALGDRVVAQLEGALAGAAVQRRLGRGALLRQGQVLLLQLRGGGGALIYQGVLGRDRRGS